MAVTYFGACDSAGTLDASWNSYDYGNANYVTGCGSVNFTCPGTGNQTLKSLGIHGVDTSGNASVRLAIYSSDRTTLIAKLTTPLEVGGPSYAWNDGTVFTGATVLVGGTAYCFEFLTDEVAFYSTMKVVTNGGANQVARTYADDFPSSVSGDYVGLPAFRCGVEPAAGGSTEYKSGINLGINRGINRGIFGGRTT